MIFLTHLKQMIMRHTQNSHIIKLRQWYLYHDEEAFRQLIQQADFSLTDNFLPEQYTKGCEYSWIKGMVDCLVYGDEFHYAVEVDDKVVGCVNISRCNGVYCQTGILRLVLMPEMCNKGIGTLVVQQIVHEALHFDPNNKYRHSQGFQRIYAETIGENKAAERVLEKNGFAFEGILKNAVCKNGKIYNQKIYGLVIEDEDTTTQNVIHDNKLRPQNTGYSNNITLKSWCLNDVNAYMDMIRNVDFTYEDEAICCSDHSDAMYELEKMIQKEESKGGFYRAIWLDNKLVGRVNVVRENSEYECNGYVGYMVTKEASGYGVGTEAVRRIIDLAFRNSNLERLTAVIYSPNKTSIRLIEKVGFTQEATIRRAVYKNGHYYDAIIYGLLRKDFDIPTPQNEQ